MVSKTFVALVTNATFETKGCVPDKYKRLIMLHVTTSSRKVRIPCPNTSAIVIGNNMRNDGANCIKIAARGTLCLSFRRSVDTTKDLVRAGKNYRPAPIKKDVKQLSKKNILTHPRLPKPLRIL